MGTGSNHVPMELITASMLETAVLAKVGGKIHDMCVCVCMLRAKERMIAEREVSGMISKDKCDRRLPIT